METPPKITVGEFYEQFAPELQLEILAGAEGLQTRRIAAAQVQKTGLALAGFAEDDFLPERVEILGQSELRYLNQLASAECRRALTNLNLAEIACFIIPPNPAPPVELLAVSEEYRIPLIRSPDLSLSAIIKITAILEKVLAPQICRHGVLVEMYGLGIMLIGDSGCGKSQCALDLIARGHRLIADDTIIIRRIGVDKLEGCAPELAQGYLEIRGLGIVNIGELFGVWAVSKSRSIDFCLQIEQPETNRHIDRLGIEKLSEELLNVAIPKVVLAVSSRSSLAVPVETAVRLYLSRQQDDDAEAGYIERHRQQLEISN